MLFDYWLRVFSVRNVAGWLLLVGWGMWCLVWGGYVCWLLLIRGCDCVGWVYLLRADLALGMLDYTCGLAWFKVWLWLITFGLGAGWVCYVLFLIALVNSVDSASF